MYKIKIQTRTGVSELRDLGLFGLSAIDKQLALIFCKHNCIGLPHGPES